MSADFLTNVGTDKPSETSATLSSPSVMRGALAGPVAFSLAWPKNVREGTVNAKTTFQTRQDAEAYANDCMWPDAGARRPAPVEVVPLYKGPTKPLTDAQIQAIWNVCSGSLPGWCRHIAYARALERELLGAA